MGKGIDLARGDAPEHAALLDDLKDQLLIVFLKRLVDKDGKLEVSVAEIDDTYHDMLALAVDMDRKVFLFELRKKS